MQFEIGNDPKAMAGKLKEVFPNEYINLLISELRFLVEHEELLTTNDLAKLFPHLQHKTHATSKFKELAISALLGNSGREKLAGLGF